MISVDAATRPAVTGAAASSFASTIGHRATGFVSRWIALPSSSSAPSALVPKTSAMIGSRVATISASSASAVRVALSSDSPRTRARSPTRTVDPGEQQHQRSAPPREQRPDRHQGDGRTR